MVPTELIEGVRAAHGRLHATLVDVTDEDARRPSRLPGWTVGHVLTHLARNADSVVRRLSAAAGGGTVEQYAGGVAGRDADIEAGAGRPAAELVADVLAADAAVDRLVADLPAEVWERPVRRSGPGGTVPAERLLFSRWREVEVHHADLGLAYAPAAWPQELVALMLPDLVAGLTSRADPAALAAWALDRGPAPTLTSWDD
jgi:maleylpyruvate isomerase